MKLVNRSAMKTLYREYRRTPCEAVKLMNLDAEFENIAEIIQIMASPQRWTWCCRTLGTR